MTSVKPRKLLMLATFVQDEEFVAIAVLRSKLAALSS